MTLDAGADMSEITVKGFIIGKCLELAREKLDDSAFAALESELGVSLSKLKMAFFRDYPVELQMQVEERVSRVLWNESYELAVYKIGRMNFTSFSQSAIGRTSLALVGKDPLRTVRATLRLISTVVSGLVIDVEERSQNEFSLRFRNSPHRPQGWKGTIDAALEQCGVTPEVEIVNHGLNDNEFVVRWREG